MGTTHANQYKRWAQPTLRTVGRRNTESQIEAPGKDSFLDVVANVVAILIILVIVVGTIRLVGSNANNVFSNVASSVQ